MTWLQRRGGQDYPDLDGNYLARLGRHLGEPALTELLSDGMIEVSDRLMRMTTAAAAGRREEVGRLAHDMIGLAGHLGLARVSLTAVDIADLARQSGAELGPAVDALAAEAEPGLLALSERIREGRRI